MVIAVFLVLFLPCAGMSSVFVVYICLLWYSAGAADSDRRGEVKPPPCEGLSAAELAKLPMATGHDLLLGQECAVCLDDVREDHPVRFIPGCNHGFHIECADTWLAIHPFCPLCRNRLQHLVIQSSSHPNLC